MAAKPKYLTGPCDLDGFQAVLKPGPNGFCLQLALEEGDEIVTALSEEREQLLSAVLGRIKTPKRAVVKPEPWEDIEGRPGFVRLKFSWKVESAPSVVDALGKLIVDEDLKLYSGAIVRAAFNQNSYLMPDKVTYGTKLILKGVQVIELPSADGSPRLTGEDAADLFGVAEGGFSVAALPDAAVADDGDEASDDDF
jgi:hypothetical protein